MRPKMVGPRKRPKPKGPRITQRGLPTPGRETEEMRELAAASRSDPYKGAIAGVIEALEEIPLVRAPAIQYLAALERAKVEVENWIEASIAAARDDVKRAEGGGE